MMPLLPGVADLAPATGQPGSARFRCPQLWVIPCGASKLEQPAPADQLYTGAMFRYTLEHVRRAMPAGDLLLILSAKHGLVATGQVLAPYDLKMGDPASAGRHMLAGQLLEHLWWSDVTLNAALPQRYLEALTAAVELVQPHTETRLSVVDLYRGCRGVGDQRHRLAQLPPSSAREGVTT